MCRNIKTLFNFDPPVTHEEVRDASLQFVRKISGFSKPSKINEQQFLVAVDEITRVSTRLLRSLETNALPKSVVLPVVASASFLVRPPVGKVDKLGGA